MLPVLGMLITLNALMLALEKLQMLVLLLLIVTSPLLLVLLMKLKVLLFVLLTRKTLTAQLNYPLMYAKLPPLVLVVLPILLQLPVRMLPLVMLKLVLRLMPFKLLVLTQLVLKTSRTVVKAVMLPKLSVLLRIPPLVVKIPLKEIAMLLLLSANTL